MTAIALRRPFHRVTAMRAADAISFTRDDGMRDAESLTLTVIATGFFGGFSGGDMHALQLARYWDQHCGRSSVFAPEAFESYFPFQLHLDPVLPRVPFERRMRTIRTYVLVLFLRMLCYPPYLNESDVVVAASHFLNDTWLGWLHHRRFGSTYCIYVHHLVDLAPRRVGLRSKISTVTERFSLLIAKYGGATFLVSDSAIIAELGRRGVSIERLALTSNGVEVTEGVVCPGRCLGDLRLIFCGRLTEEKGALDLPLIARRLGELVPDAQLDVLGEGPLFEFLLGEVQRVPLPNLRIHGFVSEKEKWLMLSRASLFIAPSVEEGWGIAVEEALAVGTPVICYDLPAYGRLEALIQVVPIGDWETMADEAAAIVSSATRLAALQVRIQGYQSLEWQSIIGADIATIISAKRD